ncbi:transporter [Alphaproteobacteria bacterium]|nr:transporter [Alphaproteobacteria bacterium]
MSSFTNLIFKKIFQKKRKESSAHFPDEDFVPYVCHYDPNTILTKNGELLQIIRVTGFSNKTVISEIISLRDAVRDSFKKNVQDVKYAVWFNTFRRKKNISPRGEFDDFFNLNLNHKWEDLNNLKSEYVNELYITVITEGIDTSITNISSLSRSFSKITTKSLHINNLEYAHKKLSLLVNNIAMDLMEYGAKILGLKEWEGVIYSEPMRFFGKLVNLYEERYPLVANDICNDLTSHKIAFGDRELEVVGYNNKNFAAIFSLKEYFEVGITALDQILQLPLEFIITQSFDFFYDEKELEPFEYQDYILKVSGDEQYRELSGLANFIDSRTGKRTDYGKLQTTLMIINKNKDDLNKDIKKAIDEFSALGFVLVREDIFMEHCFWSQMPANFSFLRRQKIINTYRIAGFASLHSFPSGSIAGNYWGSAICAFKTVLNTPFFFNFHDADNGHTLVVGPKSSGKTLLINFLLSQSQKIKPKTYIFDFNNSSQCFVELSGGKYFDLSINDKKSNYFLSLNPLKIEHNGYAKNFLIEFFKSLVFFRKNSPPQQQIEVIPDVIDRIFAANCQDFKSAVEVFNANETAVIYENLQIWSEGKLSYVFNNLDDFELNKRINGFDFTIYRDQKPILIPLFLYILYRIEKNLDGSPAVIVLNQAFEFIGNVLFSSGLLDFMERMRQKNCVIIFTAQDDEIVNYPDLSKVIVDYCSTEIYLPNPTPNIGIKEILNFDKEELDILKMMEVKEHHFMLRHAEESLIATLNLNDLIGYSKILSCNQETIDVVQAIIANLAEKNGSNPSIKESLPIIIDTITDLENQRVQAERERIRQINAEARRALQKKLEENG